MNPVSFHIGKQYTISGRESSAVSRAVRSERCYRKGYSSPKNA